MLKGIRLRLLRSRQPQNRQTEQQQYQLEPKPTPRTRSYNKRQPEFNLQDSRRSRYRELHIFHSTLLWIARHSFVLQYTSF